MVEILKHAKFVLSLVIVAVLLVSIWVPAAIPMTSNEVVHQTPQTRMLSYEAHAPIDIISDDDFNATAFSEGWEGDGSSGTPFLIQGYEISPTIVDIYIRNTRFHFKILDCNITGASSGIHLQNATNGVIQNCLFATNGDSIFLENVTGIDVIGCRISNPTSFGNGIKMHDAINCTISSSVMQGVTDTEAGIIGWLCEGITLFNNTVFDFDRHGFYLSQCYDTDILNNTVYWNEGSQGELCGINLLYSELAYICGNNITENANSGISLLASPNVTIIENHIVDNYYFGIYLHAAQYCIIQDNWIEGNGVSGTSGLLVYVSNYYQVIGNEFHRNSENSIQLQSSNFGWVFNNYINDSYDIGIEVLESHNVTIEENEIYHSYGTASFAGGISMNQSNNATIIHNILGHNSDNGLYIINCQDGKVIGNTIFDSEIDGLYVTFAAGWNISHNVIYDDGGSGINMVPPTDNNVIYYNDIGWSVGFLVADNGAGNNFWNYSTTGNWYSDFPGTGTYAVPGIAVEIDYYPSRSLYCGETTPSEYEVGTTGNTMIWDSSALNPETYELLIDDVSQGHEIWDGSSISADVDGLPVGVYNVTLVVYHVSGHWLSNQSTLSVVDTEGPVWGIIPANQHLEYGTPLAYQIDATDPSAIDEYWLTGDVGFEIDSSGFITNTALLEVGLYEIIVHANDTFGFEIAEDLSIYVTDTITPEWDTTPTDQEINVGEAFSYQLGATDLAGVSWSVNNTVYFAISQDGLITNAIDLAPGTYNLEITVTDGHSNSISITIEISVNELALPLDTTLIVAIGGVGAGVIIILLVVVLKKKGT